MSLQLSLAPIISALKDLPGSYFTFPDTDGEEYVLVRQTEFARLRQKANEVQPSLLEATPHAATADDMLGKINRDIALWQLQQDDESTDESSLDSMPHHEETTNHRPLPPRPPQLPNHKKEPLRRVRFEPLRGDLPPDLQE